jgi:addiction module HigA family antidote
MATPEQESPVHPGIFLKKNFLDPLGITPYRLARCIGVHVRRVSELVKGNRAITPDTAARLALFFDVPASWWLEMQARFDAHCPERLAVLAEVVQPYGNLDEVLVTPRGVERLAAREPALAPSAGSVVVSDALLRRLKEQAKLADRRVEREPKEVTLPGGFTMLTGS